MIMNEKMHTEPSAKMLLTIDQNVVDENILAGTYTAMDIFGEILL